MSALTSFGVEFLSIEFLIFNFLFYLFAVHAVPQPHQHSYCQPSSGSAGILNSPHPTVRGKMSQYVTLSPPRRDLAYVSSAGVDFAKSVFTNPRHIRVLPLPPNHGFWAEFVVGVACVIILAMGF